MVHKLQRIVERLLDYEKSTDPRARLPKDVTLAGNGSMRTAYRYRNIVIKIPRRGEGVRANHREFGVWQRSPARFRRFLVPVVGMLGDALIMEHVPPLQGVQEDDEDFLAYGHRIERVLNKLIKRVDPDAWGCGDVHADNVAEDGRLFDYAGF